MTSDYVPGGDPIILTVGEVINPRSTKPVDDLIIVLLAEGQFAIDEFNGITPWTLTTGGMSSVSINPSGNYIAYSSNLNYEIMFSPNHDIPIDGYVDVWIPNEIQVPDTSYSTSSCSAPQPNGFPFEAVTCQILNYDDDNVDGRWRLRVVSAFTRESGRANTQYKIVLPGVQNPIMTSATRSFLINSFTVDDYGVDSFEGANI
jgi:hypothetical protein